jgi:hypothetical protein
MSSPIISIEDLSDLPTAMLSAGVSVEHVNVFATAIAQGEATLALIAGRSGPPPEVRTQIAAAARIEEQLRESGRQLRFSLAEGGRTLIEVCDHDGNPVGCLSAADALEVAAGRPLE